MAGQAKLKMAANPPIEKLQQLDAIEHQIAAAMQSAGHALLELSKDKPSIKQVESHSSQFLDTLQNVEKEMNEQLKYLIQVSTGQPHEGSCYGALKDALMALHRVEHIKSRLNELDKLKMQQRLQQSRTLAQTSGILPRPINEGESQQMHKSQDIS